MATLEQLPAELNLEIGLGDDLSMPVDFSIDLTGYTFAAKVVRIPDETITDIAVANTNLATGQIALSLTDAQITALGVGNHRWYLIWTIGSASRRVLAGGFAIKAYPQ